MLRLLVLCGGLLLSTLGNAQVERCGTQTPNPAALEVPAAVKARWTANEQRIQRRLAQQAGQRNDLVTIPVVVHVVYNSAEQNISDAQIESQIEVLNADYNALNDMAMVPPAFAALATSLNVEFCIAQVDPDGQLVPGIVRTETPFDDVGILFGPGNRERVFYSDIGGSDAWDTERYLNIWVADMGTNLAGKAAFPGEAPPAEDGVRISYRYFGTTGTAADEQPYHLGRTLTHEIGHYFGLHHVWGPSSNGDCTEDDGVADTPMSSHNYVGECPVGPQISCNTVDAHMNFLYYTDDACMGFFTAGQCARMSAAIAEFRPLLGEGGCAVVSTSTAEVPARPFRIYPNPADDQVTLAFPDFAAAELDLVDVTGRTVWRHRVADVDTLTLPVHRLAEGIYVLRRRTKTGTQTRRLLVQHR